jgi:hypothetical protein
MVQMPSNARHRSGLAQCPSLDKLPRSLSTTFWCTINTSMLSDWIAFLGNWCWWSQTAMKKLG